MKLMMSKTGLCVGLILALLAVCGCSMRLHEPAPILEPEWHHQSWRIHCETAQSHEPVPDAAPGVHHTRWIWAAAPDGRDYRLLGGLQDGFLAVKGVALEGEAAALDQPVNLEWLRDRCLDTLERRDDRLPLELGRVMAARHGENINVPILLPRDDGAKAAIRRIVVFGDSLSDTGLLKRRLHVLPKAPYWLGRFSNGPVWVDYLEAGTSLAVQNHSYGGAAITHHDHVPGDGLLQHLRSGTQFFVSGSIGHQIQDYLTRFLVEGSIRWADETAFVIWAGANEYISKEPISAVITTFLNKPGQETGYRKVADEAISSMEQRIRDLYAAGARKFVVINLPDLGRTPIVLQNKTYLPADPVDSEEGRRLELAWRLTALTDYHNHALAEMVNRLHQGLHQAKILELDAADLIIALSENRLPKVEGRGYDLGFSLEGQRVVLSYGDRTRPFHTPCFTGGYLGTSDNHKVCENEATALFWDVVHPTSYTHCWQAWFFENALAEAGWIDTPRHPEKHRKWCRTISERTRGATSTEWMLSPE
jgi:phospholipase/lecithinase/hemolysin